MPVKKKVHPRDMTVSQMKERKNELIRELNEINEAINELLGVQQDIQSTISSPNVLMKPSFPPSPGYSDENSSGVVQFDNFDPMPMQPMDPYQSEEYLKSLKEEVEGRLNEDQASGD